MRNDVDAVKRLLAELDGKIEEIGGPLPDGSGFALMSLPLPADHWSTRKEGKYEAPPMPFRMGVNDPRHEDFCAKIRAAGKYTYRSARLDDPDHDPDAFLQNLVVGMLGYWTEDGLTEDAWACPDPVPPIFTGGE